MSRPNLARVLAGLILLSALGSLPINWAFVTNWPAYDNPAGIVQAVSTLSYWLTIAGAALIVADRKAGFWWLLAGTVLSIVGQIFSYIPFVPWFRWNPLFGLLAMYATNLSFVAIIGYCYLKAPRPEAG